MGFYDMVTWVLRIFDHVRSRLREAAYRVIYDVEINELFAFEVGWGIFSISPIYNSSWARISIFGLSTVGHSMRSLIMDRTITRML